MNRYLPVVSALALALATAPFLFDFPFLRSSTRTEGAVINIAIKPAIATALAFTGFAIRRRSLGFYRIQGFGWRAFGAMSAALAAVYLMLYLGASLAPSAMDGPSTDAQAGVPIYLAIAGAFAAGICEEFIFRAFAIEELAELFGTRARAALFSILLFTAAHVQVYGWTLGLFFPAIMGVIFTWLYLRWNSLLLCMAMHSIVDLTAQFNWP
jgi:membrane protease YdiL (CAAX protease family)